MNRIIVGVLRLIKWAGVTALLVVANGLFAQAISLVPGETVYKSGGGTIHFTATFTYDTAPAALGLSVSIPAGWIYEGGSNEPDIKPVAGATGSLDWAYSAGFGTGQSGFMFTLRYPAGLGGEQVISGEGIYRSPLTALPLAALVFSAEPPPPARSTLWPGSPVQEIVFEPNEDPTLRYHAKGLPAGLKIDARTGEITGVVSGKAKPGRYLAQFWTITGRVKGEVFTREFVVEAMPAYCTGSFDGLLRQGGGAEPLGRVEITVNAQGGATGKLVYRDSKTYLLRGALTVADGGARAWMVVRVALATGVPLWLGFELGEGGEAGFSGSFNEEEALTGLNMLGEAHRRGRFTASTPAPWQGRYTGYFDRSPLDTEAEGPGGAGYAVITIDAKGLVLIRGKLSDGIALTASMPTAVQGEAVLFATVYKRADSFFGGVLNWEQRGEGGPYYVNEEGGGMLVWKKAANAKDKGHRAGFGPLDIVPVIRAWTPPLRGQTLADVVQGLSAGADIGLILGGGGLSNEELPRNRFDEAESSNVYGLPATVRWNAKGDVVTSAEYNPVKLSGNISPATGRFTGSFILRDQVVSGGKATTISRTVKLEGVWMRPDGEAGISGCGFFLLPSLASGGEMNSGLVAFTPETFREKQMAPTNVKAGDVLKLAYDANGEIRSSIWTITGPTTLRYDYALFPKGNERGQAQWAVTALGRNTSRYEAYPPGDVVSVSLSWETPSSGIWEGSGGHGGTFTFTAK